jgi:predicted 3-demethylubiquinone-9 3-methyltransferase (glyoxalase superfamily)
METLIKQEPGKKMKDSDLQKITPFLWFDNQAEEAANFYVSIFKDSKIKSVNRYTESGAKASGREKGSIMTVGFQLERQDFAALNGGPVFEITPSVSFFVSCITNSEIDTLWNKLTAGGSVLMALDKYPFSEKFGWLKDKFGVTWQLNLAGARQKITPYLMFSGQKYGRAREAVFFYVSVFRNSEIINIEDFGTGDDGCKGTVKKARFSLNNQEFMAFDSTVDHPFTFTPGFSFVVNCENQEEIDYFWEKLSAGGDESAQQCGWLEDKFGLSWQIVPADWEKMLREADAETADRLMQAVLRMKKIDINAIRKAYEDI